MLDFCCLHFERSGLFFASSLDVRPVVLPLQTARRCSSPCTCQPIFLSMSDGIVPGTPYHRKYRVIVQCLRRCRHLQTSLFTIILWSPVAKKNALRVSDAPQSPTLNSCSARFVVANISFHHQIFHCPRSSERLLSSIHAQAMSNLEGMASTILPLS